MSTEPITVRLLDRDWTFRPPPGFTEREELVLGVGRAKGDPGRMQRVSAALLGMCLVGTPADAPKRAKEARLGAWAGADYDDCGCSPLTYGGRVNGWLRERGVEAVDIFEAATTILPLLAATVFPTAGEVEARADFSDPPGA